MSRIDNISFTKIIESFHFFKYTENGFAINDYNKNVNISHINLFRYPFRFDGVIIVYTPTGINGNVTINLNNISITGNQLFIVKPGDIIIADAYGESTPRAILMTRQFLQNLHFMIDDIIPAYLKINDNPILQLTKSEITILDKYYSLINENINNNGIFSNEIIEKLVSVYLFKIANILQGHCNDFKESEIKKQKRETQIFNKFIKLISDNKFKERKVDFYAQELHLSTKYFSTLIKRSTGNTASEWINNYVIQEAKSLLKYSSMSIQEIAYYLNFPNQSFFGKYFKHHTGMTPKSYKQS